MTNGLSHSLVVPLLLVLATVCSGCAAPQKTGEELSAMSVPDLLALQDRESIVLFGRDMDYVESIRNIISTKMYKADKSRYDIIRAASFGNVAIGMTIDEAHLAWGRPTYIRRGASPYGETEVWTKGDGIYPGQWTISFRNGLVEWMHVVGPDD